MKWFRTSILFGACVIGIIGGFAALCYNFLLQFFLKVVWHDLYGSSFTHVFTQTGHRWSLIAITTVGGFFVGCCLKWFGAPGEIAAVVDNIHMKSGRIDIKQTPSMIANSLVSITAGGSAGPEAPLVQIIGSFGSWLGEFLGLSDDKVRIYTFCGMATALGAFFGAPIGGALFALEIPHKRGLEYYEALLPSCVAAVVGFLVFRGILGWHAPIYSLPAFHQFSSVDLFIALFLGLGGAVLGIIFAFIFSQVDKVAHLFKNSPILLATIGGLLIGAVALYCPQTLFWSEFQIHDLFAHATQFTGAHLFVIALLKMMTIGLTLHFGFRGGFIFPLFFIGAAVGIGMSLIFPWMPMAVAALSLMAALNVAVTKTPIATTVILTALSGVSLMPVIAVASFTAILVSSKVEVIRSQRSRELEAA